MDASSHYVADAIRIAELAALSDLEYDRVRETAAEDLRVRASTLDAQVRAARAASRASRAESQAPAFSDEALALRFSDLHANRLRYVADWGKWMEWTGSIWKADDTVHVFDLARSVCREASAACNDQQAAPRIASASTVSAVERLARSDRRHAATAANWDADGWRLNTPGGVVDLRTGGLVAHSPADLMTKSTTTAPAGECPQWHTFLATITNDDLDLQDYLQRVAGYCLTGSTKEHALFFCYGTGGNGKGVFLNTLTGILDSYAKVAGMETFTASSSDRHPTDLAMLRGARLVTAQETEDGRRWAESRIKAMTGGDPITARFMRGDFFTYQPQFKLIIAGNHKPGLRNVDEAIRRRFHLIPFDVTISPDRRDPELPEKLKAEWAGILQWMVQGCLEWQRVGLQPPEAVTAATEEYFDAEDAIGLWLKECCVDHQSATSSSSQLFKSWTQWAQQANEAIGSQKLFSQKLAGRGYDRAIGTVEPHKGKAIFKGIKAVEINVKKHWQDTGTADE